MQRQGEIALLDQSANVGKMVNLHGKMRNTGTFCEARQALRAWRSKPRDSRPWAFRPRFQFVGLPLLEMSNASPHRDGARRMTDPFAVLGISAELDDEAIRRRYLELVKQFPPERQPEKFAEIRRAYEALRDLDARLRYGLFEAGKGDSIDAILEELTCPTSRRRMSLPSLIRQAQKP
jgi:preprotein translocase subunit Sec63